MTDEMTPEEIIAHVLERNYDYPYESFHYVAVDILKDLKYNDMVESMEEITRLEKKLEAAEQIIASLIAQCESHVCSGNKEGEDDD